MKYQERNGHPVIWMVYDGLLTMPFSTQERAVEFFTGSIMERENSGDEISDYTQTGANGERSCIVSPKSGRPFVAMVTCERMDV